MTEQTSSWKDWNPGLDIGELTLQQALETLPGNEDHEIHLIIRLFENPSSPIAFTGAISLERHDMLHILLGRGLLPQDEAFVIGFTMGTSKHISNLEAWFFQMITKYLYPAPYNFTEDHLKAFRLGLETGKNSLAEKIYEYPIEDHQHDTIAEIRAHVGVDVEELKEIYKREKELLPGTVESERIFI